MKTICLTGGSGFLGQHLITFLQNDDNLQIKALTRNRERELTGKNLSQFTGDLLDPDSLKGFIEPGAVVINLAFLSGGEAKENLRAVECLAQLAAQNRADRFLHCSSAVVVGDAKEDLITEDTMCLPVTEYEKTKLALETKCLDVLRGKLPVVIVRPTAIFGKGGKNLLKQADEISNGSVASIFIKSMLGSDRRLNMVAVENVTAALKFLATTSKNIDGERFIVSDDESKENSYKKSLLLLAESLGMKEPQFAPFSLPPSVYFLVMKLLGRSNTNPNRTYSCQKLLNTGFVKQVEYAQAVKIFAKGYLNRN